MTAALVLAALAYASYRVARLITADTLLERPRDALIMRRPPELHKSTALVTCPFCVGFWTSGGLLAVAHATGLAAWPLRYDLVLWWAVAGGQALISAIDGKLTG